MGSNESLRVRLAVPADRPSVMNVIDGALLAAEASTIAERTGTENVLVASTADRVRGVLVHSGAEIEVIAVRRRYRARGIGTALVERARERTSSPLLAAFDGSVRPFYESLGFDVWSIGENRFRGRDTAD